MGKTAISAVIALILLSSCADDGISSAEVESAAEQRVRDKLGLSTETDLQTTVYVGRPRDGDITLCGAVDGTRAAGSAIPTQRFISSTDPARWLLFGETDSPGRVSMPSMFPDWTKLCDGARGRQS